MAKLELLAQVQEMIDSYKCLNCYRVFYDWRIANKYRGRCSYCGGVLQEIHSTNNGKKGR